MACINPPALGDDLLLLYLDGDQDQNIIDHLAVCSYCREQAEALKNFQARLTAKLFRYDCPSTIELGEFHLALVTEDRGKFIASHLQTCPHCNQELETLALNIQEDDLDPASPPVSALKILLARLTTGLTPSPAFGGLRGQGDRSQRYTAGEFEITLEVQADLDSSGHRALLGLVLGAEESGLKASLYRSEIKVADIPLDALGNFVIPGLDPGQYDLHIQGTQVEIHIPGIGV